MLKLRLILEGTRHGYRALEQPVIGAAACAGADRYMDRYVDRQEEKLRTELERTGASVTRVGDNITFATKSADLNAKFFEILNSVAIVINEFEQTVIAVAGYTDDTGSDA